MRQRDGRSIRRRLRTLSAISLATIGMTLLAAPPRIVAAEPDGPARVVDENAPRLGERLSPDSIGPIVIETMADAVARDRHAPPIRKAGGAERIGRNGVWVVPSRNGTYYPHSGQHYTTNKWGDTRMGIGFPEPVTVNGTFIAGQGGVGAWADAVRVVGYRNEVEVGRTAWFAAIGDTPAWFAIGLEEVDRIVFEAQPSLTGGGWFAIDDFSYSIDSANDVDVRPTIVLDFENCDFRDTLTDSGYAGLTWEHGTGVPGEGDAVHAPMVPDEKKKDDDEEAGGEPPPPALPLGDATLPDLIDDFATVKRGDANSFSFPPDTCGAAGPNHIVVVVNRNFAVYNKNTGAQQVNIQLNSFHPGSNGDPRVLYDHHAGRWVVINTDFNSRIFVAYSLTDNPMGQWLKTSYIASQGSDSGRWPDYPTLGLDANGIYIAAYMVGDGGNMTIWAIDKAPLLEDPPSLDTITAWRNLSWDGAIQPCLTYGDSGGVFLVSRRSSTRIRVRKITGSLTNPSLSTVSNVTIPSHDEPPDAPALGSAVPLDTVGPRLINAVYRDGFIYTTHTIGINNRAAVRWYKISTQSFIDTPSTIVDSSMWYYFPSISVDVDENVALGFTGSNPSIYAGCYYTGWAASDPPGVTADPVEYKAGTGAQNNIDGFGRNRWGDYSLTTADPVDDSLWTIQAYGRSPDIWGTWIARLEFDADPPAPDNDDCLDAQGIVDGSIPFTTISATTDGPDESNLCDFLGDTTVQADVWFRYFAPCDGIVTVDVCDVDFDAKVAIYNGLCPSEPNTAIACNDDGCGDGSFQTFSAEQNELYLIRIGGYLGETGSGTLSIGCQPIEPQCPEDLDGNDVVNVFDLLDLLAAWGPCAGCDADLDGNDVVNVFDLLDLLAAWGPCP